MFVFKNFDMKRADLLCFRTMICLVYIVILLSIRSLVLFVSKSKTDFFSPPSCHRMQTLLVHQTKACGENEETHNIDSVNDIKRENVSNTDDTEDNETNETVYI